MESTYRRIKGTALHKGDYGMTREEKEQWDIFMKIWVIPALKNTWNEKKCKEIVEALEEWEEQEPMTAEEYRQRMIQAFHNANTDELIALCVFPTEKEFEHLEWLLKNHYKQKTKTGHWIDDKCSVCGKGIENLIDSREWYRNEQPNFCPFCGLKLADSQESEGEELKRHCLKQIEGCEMWAKHKGEEPRGKIYEEHKLILELLAQESCDDVISRQAAIRIAEQGQVQGYEWQFKELVKLSPVNPQSKMGEWISVEDMLPEEGEEVLVWYRYWRYGEYNNGYYTYVIGYQYTGIFSVIDGGVRQSVYAWQELPEQYIVEPQESEV